MLFAFLCVLPGIGQTPSATLAETTEWLQNNVGGMSCIAFSMGKTKAEAQQHLEGFEATFADCEMTLDTSVTIGSAGSMGSYRVHLGRLDPGRIAITPAVQTPEGWFTLGELPQAGIRLVTRNDEKLINAMTQPQTGPSNVSTFRTAEINIPVRSGASVQPLVNAFSRAIALCQP